MAASPKSLLRVLVAIDGSEQAYEAVRALASINRPEALIVLHAIDVPEPAYLTMVPEAARELHQIQEHAMREEGARVLKTALSVLPLEAGPAVTRLDTGKPAETILAVAEREGIDMIILGSRGVGAVREVVLGSVSHRVVTHAPCSVLVVPERVRPLGHILFALAGPDDTDAVLRLLARAPWKTPCQSTALTVLPYARSVWPIGAWPVNAIIPNAIREDLQAEATRFVETAAAAMTTAGYPATAVACEGLPAGEILRYASDTQSDLIVVGTRHHGFARTMMGSVCHSVLHKARVPVLVVR